MSRQEEIVARFNAYLTTEEGIHLIIEEMNDYRLKDFINVILYVVVEMVILVFVNQYLEDISVYPLMAGVFLCSTLLESLYEHIETPIEDYISFPLVSLSKEMRTSYTKSIRKELLVNCVFLSLMICLQSLVHLVFFMLLRVIVGIPYVLFSFGVRVFRNIRKQMLFTFAPLVVIADIMTDVLFGEPISAHFFGHSIPKRKKYYDTRTKQYPSDPEEFDLLYRKNRMLDIFQMYPCFTGHLVSIQVHFGLIIFGIVWDIFSFLSDEIMQNIIIVFKEHVIINFEELDDHEKRGYSKYIDSYRGFRMSEFNDSIFIKIFCVIANKMNVPYTHLVIRGIPFITMSNTFFSLFCLYYFLGLHGLVIGVAVIFGFSSMTTLQYLSLSESMYHQLTPWVYFCVKVKGSIEPYVDLDSIIVKVMACIYAVFFTFPYCVMFYYGFYHVCHVLCVIYNDMKYLFYNTNDHTCNIAIYNVVVFMMQVCIIALNLSYIWCLLVHERDVTFEPYSLSEIIQVVLFAIFLFGVFFGFSYELLYLCGIYLLISPYFLYQYNLKMERKRQQK